MGSSVSPLHRLRTRLKPLVPRRFQHALTKAVFRAVGVALRGDAVECPCCGGRFRRFVRYPSLYCPRCGSYERHRAFCAYLRERGDLFDRPIRLLHVAPEEALERHFRGRPGVEYVSIDLEYPLAMRRMDVTAMDFEDGSFDVVLCLHMLNEVPDESAALRELARVTASRGEVFVQLPFHLQRPDFPAALEAAGLDVEERALAEELGPEAVRRYGLLPAERLYVCRRSDTSSRTSER
jgi:SAM-dependent methyltransferase